MRLTSCAPIPQVSVSQILDISILGCGTCGYQWTQLNGSPAFLNLVCPHLLLPSHTNRLDSIRPPRTCLRRFRALA